MSDAIIVAAANKNADEENFRWVVLIIALLREPVLH
jgi:hypothetical protein